MMWFSFVFMLCFCVLTKMRPNGCKLSDAFWRGRTWRTEPALPPESVRCSAGLGLRLWVEDNAEFVAQKQGKHGYRIRLGATLDIIVLG